jgi:isocitrate/isopropylmalate dehydrogenase
MGLSNYAANIERAALGVRCGYLELVSLRVTDVLHQTIAEGKSITRDLGGTASTEEYTGAIISKLK